MKLIKTNSFTVHHVVCCCYHSNHNDWFSNLLLLFLKMSHADLYLQAFWSIYWIGQILVIREPSPFKALASLVFEIICWQDSIHIFSKGQNSGKGHNPDGKKICVSYCSWGIHIWNFKTSVHSSKHAMHQKECNVKMPKVTTGHFRIYSEVNQVIYS